MHPQILDLTRTHRLRRVRDRELRRTCAYKAIRPELLGKPSAVARFVEEAQIGAQLQHPNIPPIYDGGRLADGRPWFTMKEIHGRTFRDLIREAHDRALPDATLRRMCDVLASVCDAVGYAHGRGVVHRDLKPANVMVGSHGEVFVLDWGLAKVIGRPDRVAEEPDVQTGRSDDDAFRTRVGGVLGTAAYMPPEQARGEVDHLDARADVYALGAVLYEVLAGRPPYGGSDARAVLRQVLEGPPEPPGRPAGSQGSAGLSLGSDLDLKPAGPVLPEELVSLCMRCLSFEPGDRPVDGAAVGAELRSWLDGAGKRAKALEVVAEADAVVAEAARSRARAVELRAEGWAKQDEAERVERRTVLLEAKREALLRGALTHVPGLPEAHAALVELELARHAAAEDARGAARAVVRLREHVEALDEHHPTRNAAAVYLKGDGALTLVTDPPGAEVLLYRYERRNRRLVEVPVRSLGRTPLRAVRLPMGSYLCRLRHPDRVEVRYPVHVRRGELWNGVPPSGGGAVPVRLPSADELGPDDLPVPAGWSWSGGDPEAVDGLPRRRLWCDELVVKRFPVTNREYIAFLDDLVATGREADAVRHQPKERSAGGASPVYGRDERGRFVLRPDADGHVWDPEYPVVLVDWFAATAYAAWLAETSGRPWRLLGELEWEKAARGVDGRYHPWGDVHDASWACVRASRPERPLPAVVDSFPVDVSVYGVRGLGGNVQDWCADLFHRDGPAIEGERVPEPVASGASTAGRCYRGGLWGGVARSVRSANRRWGEPTFLSESIGFRLAFRPPSRRG